MTEITTPKAASISTQTKALKLAVEEAVSLAMEPMPDVPKTSADRDAIYETMRKLKLAFNRVDPARKALTAPFDEAKALVMKQVKEALDPADARIAALTKLIGDYDRIVAEEIRKAQEAAAAKARAEAEAAAKEREDASANDPFYDESDHDVPVMVETTAAIAPKAKGTRTVKVIVSVDFNKVPDKYVNKSLNNTLALADLNAGVNIPGIEWREEVKVV